MKPHDQRLIFALMSLLPDRGVDADAMPSYDFGGGCDMDTTCDARFSRIEGKLDHVDSRLVRVEAKLDHVESRLTRIESEVSGLRWWVLGGTLTIIAIVIAYGQFQASWFMHSLDTNREISRAAEARSEEAQASIEESLKILREQHAPQPAAK